MNTDQREELTELAQDFALIKCPACNNQFHPRRKSQKFCSRPCGYKLYQKPCLPLLERFWNNVQKTDTCWIWTKARTIAGYGCISDKNQHYYTHRLSWELHNGPIPTGLFICHHCDNPSCVNPAHLFIGTHKDNMRDCAQKGRQSTFRPRFCGSDARWAKLNESKVTRIRAQYKDGNVSIAQLARDHGVTGTAITSAINRITWKHVE